MPFLQNGPKVKVNAVSFLTGEWVLFINIFVKSSCNFLFFLLCILFLFFYAFIYVYIHMRPVSCIYQRTQMRQREGRGPKGLVGVAQGGLQEEQSRIR